MLSSMYTDSAVSEGLPYVSCGGDVGCLAYSIMHLQSKSPDLLILREEELHINRMKHCGTKL